MSTDLFDPTAPSAALPDGEHLGAYAQRANLEYALSVVKGCALPDVCGGQKPMQRRILHAMDRMGLGYSGNTASIRHTKARFLQGLRWHQNLIQQRLQEVLAPIASQLGEDAKRMP